MFGPLCDFAREQGCQAKTFAPGQCCGPVQACHALARGMGGARGDWIRIPDGEQGNVFGACAVHHAWCDNHKKESMTLMLYLARWNGEQSGLEPIF